MKTKTTTTTIPQVPAHGANWPNPSERCWCEECTEVRRIRSAAALATRAEALRRGLSQSVADRAASYRMDTDSIDAAIAEAYGVPDRNKKRKADIGTVDCQEL